jgi:hypothetical protein
MNQRNLTDRPTQSKSVPANVTTTEASAAVANDTAPLRASLVEMPRPKSSDLTTAGFTDWARYDPATLPPRQWIYGGHYIEGCVSATISDGGVGKSSLALTEAIAMVSEEPLLGFVPSPCNIGFRAVTYFNAEESREELLRRAYAICQYYNVDHDIIQDHLTVISGRDCPLTIGFINEDGKFEINWRNMEQLEKLNSNVIILDPFVSLHRCPESDNNSIDRIVKGLARLATTKTWRGLRSIELVHHARKAKGGITGTDTRGASALFDGVRSLRVLNRMTEAEANRLKVENPQSFFRVNGDKANYRAVASEPMWLQHKSVTLPNGEDVGVVVPWKAPSVLDGISPAHVKQVCDLARDNDYRVDPRANNWVGNVVADVLGFDVEDEIDRERVKIILGEWYKNQTLKKVERKDKWRRLTLVAEPGKPRSSR